MSVELMEPGYFYPRELNRGISSINGYFVDAFFADSIDHNPTSEAVRIAREQGGLTILDAGCGAGQALIDLKDQTEFRARIPAERILAIGIDLMDHRKHLSDDYLSSAASAERAYNGYAKFIRGDLATPLLRPETVDLAYSHEVLIHSQQPAAIIAQVLEVLKRGGVYYCNSMPEQVTEISPLNESLKKEGWTVATKEVTKTFYTGETDTRVFHRFVKP